MSDSNQVYAAIAKVMAAVGKDGIQKDRKNEQQGYKFRGIDDVYNALSSHLAAAQLVILPRVLSRSVTERTTKSGTALFYVVLDVEFDLVSAEDGSKHTVRTVGEAMDSGDKATNKAMSAAYKYMAMEVFCIPTDADNDADLHTHEVKPNTASQVNADEFDRMPADEQKFLQDQATIIIDAHANGEDTLAIVERLRLDNDEKMALWSLLPSKVRSALKKAAEADRRSKPTQADYAMQA